MADTTGMLSLHSMVFYYIMYLFSYSSKITPNQLEPA
jgi:hypothetical protein